ncbi:hypothetical protein AURDEDRAFT_113322 [Auricularia subglabra TFB-10046 SS5]|nr:hypothetical protein AURDEDRAFT_113322 [Auricularia subglabra TFB-10046 SS5]
MCAVEDLTLGALAVGMLDGLVFTHKVKTLRFRYYTATSSATLRMLSRPTDDGARLCPQLAHVSLPQPGDALYLTLRGEILAFVRARGSCSAASTRPRERLCALSFDSESAAQYRPFLADLEESISGILNPVP